jgi:hypothetical protein
MLLLTIVESYKVRLSGPLQWQNIHAMFRERRLTSSQS